MNEWKELSTLQQVAEAQANRWEIQTRQGDYQEWHPWFGTEWNESRQFRGRIAKPEPKKIKLEAWLSGTKELRWFHEDAETPMLQQNKWIRVPSEDKEITLP